MPVELPSVDLITSIPECTLLRNNMALSRRSLIALDELEYVESLIRCFEALASVKKLKDNNAFRMEKEIIALLLFFLL